MIKYMGFHYHVQFIGIKGVLGIQVNQVCRQIRSNNRKLTCTLLHVKKRPFNFHNSLGLSENLKCFLLLQCTSFLQRTQEIFLLRPQKSIPETISCCWEFLAEDIKTMKSDLASTHFICHSAFKFSHTLILFRLNYTFKKSASNVFQMIIMIIK